MFRDICNENSISVKIKAIYSAVTNVIRIKKITICLRFTSESTFMANVKEDIFIDQSALTAYFMRTNILHRSWHLIGQTTLGQHNVDSTYSDGHVLRWPNVTQTRWTYDSLTSKLTLGQRNLLMLAQRSG